MNLLPLKTLLIAFLLYAPRIRAIEISAQGSAVVIAPSKVEIGGQSVTVKEPATIPVAPAPILRVSDEALALSVDKPVGWAKGARLSHCLTRGVNAYGSFVPGSLEVRRSKDGEVLTEGSDYLVDAAWGHVGLGPQSRVTAADTVFASYRYSLLRMDTVQVSADGRASLKQGLPHISAPVPPEADAGSVAVAHVFVNYRDTEVKPDQIYPITEVASQATTASTAGRIPKTLAKLQAGQPVKIVCWGDSVTSGGDASKPELRYVDVFAVGLRTLFPKSEIDVKNISAGGSQSRQWLEPEKFPYQGLQGAANLARFERIIAAQPDLVTLEFVNDAYLDPAQLEVQYSQIMKRLEPTGAEVILITPHFTMWRMMGFKEMRGADKRPYVLGLRAFAEKNNLALADASARWEHLAKEGLPYLTLLYNTINHPDDRGHQLFAEELWKCFR